MAADIYHGAGSGVGDPVPPSGPELVQVGEGWTVARLVTLVAGSVLILLSVVLLAGAGVLTWADQAQQRGYLTTGTATYSTAGYALTSNPATLHGPWGWLGRWASEVRIRVTASRPGAVVFVAVGPAGDVSRYLTGASYTSVTALGDQDVTIHPGAALPAPPATALPWTTQASGTGTMTLRWPVSSGNWLLVVMNHDGSPGVAIRADVAVSSPVLPSLAAGLLVGGLAGGLVGAALVVVAARRTAGMG
jgi:hypothetical protein